jgi:hypothetical protein
MGSAALSPPLPARSRAWPLASTIRTLPIFRVRPERFVSETTTATLAIGTDRVIKRTWNIFSAPSLE